MAIRVSGWLARRVRQRAARQWQRLAAAAAAGDGPRPGRRLRDEASALRGHLSLLLMVPRAAPSSAALQSRQFPPGSDWFWRPAILDRPIYPPAMVAPLSGRQPGPDVALWHDCPHRALILRQQPNRGATDLAAHGLRLEVMGFAGSYLSLSLDLPAQARENLSQHHVLRLETALQTERPASLYVRLNIAQGVNTETILRGLGDPVDGSAGQMRAVEFDLGYADLQRRPVDKLWLDLIVEAPHMNALTLSDLVMSRHCRAEF